MSDITISSAVRSNLNALQDTAKLVDRTNNRFSTGKKVASATDDAVAYFQGKALSDRATDLMDRKGSIEQGIASVNTAIGALEAVEKILNQMKGVALSAKSADKSGRSDLATQFTELSKQLNNLVNDASYQGLNLVNVSTAKLSVQFSDKTTAVLDIKATNILVSKVITAAADKPSAVASKLLGTKWDSTKNVASSFNKVVQGLEKAITKVRNETKKLGNNVALLQTRLDFTVKYASTMTDGALKLTAMDVNEEGANLVTLQTRQQLGVQALALAGQQESSVLQLFR